ncbi:ribosome-inactivating family protein [Spiroplasma endosymbiont of Tipula paludosa]|uniref:ribosome-inactivating family protein n=1 Tax=Spiroplasma endosymbiont of Tipula paludosa TaxID=3066295 RepID=UPI0035C91BC6
MLEGRDIQLVFRSSDFYLEGVSVVTNNEVPLSWYYHFSDSTITELSGYVSRSFGFSGNYNNLMPMPDSREVMVRWDNNITQAFWDIINYGDNPSSSGNVSVIRGALARVILATSESIRFRVVRNSIINYNPINATWGFYHNHITNWDDLTNQSIDYVDQHGTLNGFLAAATILMFSRRMDAHLHSCNRRQAKDLNSNKYCFNMPEKIVYFRGDHGVSEHYAEYSYSSREDIFYDYSEVEVGDIDPLNYNKIEFFGEQLTKVSWGNDAYYRLGT